MVAKNVHFVMANGFNYDAYHRQSYTLRHTKCITAL